jgi:hypothetical protein
MVLLLSTKAQLLLLKALGRANSTSRCAAPNILKDVRVRLTRTDIKDIANNHARTLANFFIPPPVSRASSSSGCAAPQHP